MLKEKNLTLAPCTELQKLNNADAPGLTVQESKVTLGGGEYTLTLNGNDKG